MGYKRACDNLRFGEPSYPLFRAKSSLQPCAHQHIANDARFHARTHGPFSAVATSHRASLPHVSPYPATSPSPEPRRSRDAAFFAQVGSTSTGLTCRARSSRIHGRHFPGPDTVPRLRFGHRHGGAQARVPGADRRIRSHPAQPARICQVCSQIGTAPYTTSRPPGTGPTGRGSAASDASSPRPMNDLAGDVAAGPPPVSPWSRVEWVAGL
jgi:hypothetical protein